MNPNPKEFPFQNQSKKKRNKKKLTQSNHFYSPPPPSILANFFKNTKRILNFSLFLRKKKAIKRTFK